MLVAAGIALFKDDLKGLLAYSTVSHLGLVTMLLGFGTPLAAVAAVFHILNHATFKAALFMNAGIVRPRGRHARHQAPRRPAAADADHGHHGDGGGRVDGRAAAVQRLPLQGDDAARGGRPRPGWATAGSSPRWRPWRRASRWPTRSATSRMCSSARAATTTRTRRTTRPSACGCRRRCWWCWWWRSGSSPTPWPARWWRWWRAR